jgi:hypothetical protein
MWGSSPYPDYNQQCPARLPQSLVQTVQLGEVAGINNITSSYNPGCDTDGLQVTAIAA